MNRYIAIFFPLVLVILLHGCGQGGVPDGFSSVINLREEDGASLGRAILVATNSDGDIYVINDEDSNKALFKFSPDGTIIRKVGGLGEDFGDYQFFFPVALSIGPDNSILVCDLGLYSVQRFYLDGKRGVYITGRAKDDTKIYEPDFVTTDSKGQIFVAGPGNNIHTFDSSGQHLSVWGAVGSGEGQYRELGNFAIDNAGNFLVLDGDRPHLYKYDPSGIFLTDWEIKRWSHAIAVDKANNIYIGGALHVQVFAPDGTLVSDIVTDEDAPAFRITSLAALPSGVLALDSDNSRLLKID